MSFAGEQHTKGDQAVQGKSRQDRRTIFKFATSSIDIFRGG